MLVFILVCVLSALIVSWSVTALMRRIAPKIGLVDAPATRKVHQNTTPLGGGIGIFCGVVLPLLAGLVLAYSSTDLIPESWMKPFLDWLSLEASELYEGIRTRTGLLWKILLGGSTLFVVGLVDDWKNLSWKFRLIFQTTLACWLVYSGVKLSLFLPYPFIAELLTVIWILVLINAFNFLDNMDGLSGGIGLISASMFAILMLTHPTDPRWLVAGLLLALVGSLLGFLWHNWHPARIFMGDAGSTFVGLLMATSTTLGTFYTTTEERAWMVLAPLCILAVPLYDFSSVLLIRLWEGRSPFQPDKKHFSHRLVALGLNSWQAVLTIHLTTLITGLAGLLLFHSQSWLSAITALLLTLGVLILIAILEMAAAKKNNK